MDSALSIRSITPILHLRTPSLSTTLKPSIKPPSPLSFPSHLHVTISKTLLSNPPIASHVRVKASFNSIPRNAGSSSPNPIIQTLRTAAVLLAAVVAAKFHKFLAWAETTPTILTEDKIHQNQEQKEEKSDDQSELLDSNSGAVESLSLKSLLLQREMEAGKDGEALEIVKKLVSAQPEETEWKFLIARMLSEIGSTRDARDVLEEILKPNPLDFEALFENALLMERETRWFRSWKRR
ncbi:hypothetical protein RHGRI_017956 [Rhododendron griersonianum]|uniref:Tetratricopeptide repeat-like superfamily protein n=1 Tax=Rhododendron griersonianum TaxID=479676 RepID=A0AAV6JZP8_9ERIC|nr:hypothetical protein RHGRI_017956 [Rhododendron griersonianum]